MLSQDRSRFVMNDNPPETNGLTLGRSWATSSHDNWFVSPELSAGLTIDDGNGWVITPSVRVRYAHQADGFSETRSNANASIGSMEFGLLEVALELELRKKLNAYFSVSTNFGYCGVVLSVTT